MKKETCLDLDDLINDSFSSEKLTQEKEDLALEYLCQNLMKSDSVENVEKRAKNGDDYAYIQLASWYVAYAENVKDYCKAFQYAKTAAQKGYVEAYYLLGQFYFYGTGCEKNIYQAKKCFRYFTEQVNSEDLLQESVLTDAHMKLAEIEKQSGQYEKAQKEYTKISNISEKEKEVIESFVEELKQDRNEMLHSIFVVGVSMLLTVFMGIIGYRSIQPELVDLQMKYSFAPKVRAQEQTGQMNMEEQMIEVINENSVLQELEEIENL